MTDTRTSIAGAVAMALVASAVLLAQQSRLKFQSGVEVIPVDVTVVDDRGVAVSNLGPDDFIVRVDGTPRRVLTAERVSDKAKSRASWAVAVPEGYSSNEESTDGRLIVLAVDLPNVRPGGGQGLMTAVEAFIDRLSPADKIAVVGLGGGAGGPGTGFTADHEQVKQAIARMKGQAVASAGQSEAARTMARCQAGFVFTTRMGRKITAEAAAEGIGDCRLLLVDLAGTLAGSGVNAMIQRLRDLLAGLRTIDGPKTLVLLSEGFIAKNRLTVAGDLGPLATAARTTVFILGLDESLFEAHGTQWPVPPEGDQWQRMQELSLMADAARGAFFSVSASGSDVFKRIEAELAGSYLLSVESTPGDRDRKSHEIRVDVARRGVTVRAQHQIPKAAAGTASRSPKEAVTAGLGAPLQLSTLPLRVTAFAMKARDSSQVYMAVHADVGTGYTAPTSVAIGMLVSDREGHVVRAALTDMKLSPTAKGAGSPLKFVGGVNLDPGEYTVKLAIAEGVRVGTVEHPFHAALVDAGALTFSDLIVGGPVPSDESPAPTAAYTVSFERVHGYLEAYGPQLDTVKVKYEIALGEREPALAGFDVAGQRIGDARMAFSGVMPVPSLPPGKYVLRAVVSEGATPRKTLSRAFEIALPMRGTTTTGDAAPTASLGELSLPVYAGTQVRALRHEALAPAVVRPFVERLRASMKQPIAASLAAALQQAADGRIGEIQLASVDSSDPVGSYLIGLTQLERGDLGAAVDSFRQAVRVEGDSVPALTYMAVCYAASGHDTEAAGAWQAALIEGSDLPQIFMWLGEALLRTDDPSGARSILEEAVGSWPTDARFARLQAMLYARSSQWAEAVRALERYIAGGYDDPDTLFLAMEWMYRMHAAGAVVQSRAEDLNVARVWAEAYAKANGTKLSLVLQWLDFLEREKR